MILVGPLLFPPVAAAARGRIAVSFLITLKVQYLLHPRVRLCMGESGCWAWCWWVLMGIVRAYRETGCDGVREWETKVDRLLYDDNDDALEGCRM